MAACGEEALAGDADGGGGDAVGDVVGEVVADVVGEAVADAGAGRTGEGGTDLAGGGDVCDRGAS